MFTECDVVREDDVRDSIEQAAARFGGLQIVVNCAGVVHVKRLHEYSAAEWDQLMAVNVRGIFFSIKHALKHLQANSHSYMVNVGSISSFVGQADTPAYTASKGAVLSLSQSIALDYAADGLRCNCLCPGVTDTPMLRHHLRAARDPAGTLAKRLARVPLGRRFDAEPTSLGAFSICRAKIRPASRGRRWWSTAVTWRRPNGIPRTSPCRTISS